jgi:hypothetical protein
MKRDQGLGDIRFYVITCWKIGRIATDIMSILRLIHPDIIYQHRGGVSQVVEVDAAEVQGKTQVSNDIL